MLDQKRVKQAKLTGCESAGDTGMSHYKSQPGAYQEVFFTEHLSIDKIKGFSSQLST